MNCPNCEKTTTVEESWPQHGGRYRERRCFGCNGEFRTVQKLPDNTEVFDVWTRKPAKKALVSSSKRPIPEGAVWQCADLYYKRGLRDMLMVYRDAAGWCRANFNEPPTEAELVGRG